MQGQVWFVTIAWPGPVCTFSCLYISDLAELYYSRVFCACANPARNRVTANVLHKSQIKVRRGGGARVYVVAHGMVF